MLRNLFDLPRHRLPFKGALDELRLLYDDAEIALTLDWLGLLWPVALAHPVVTAKADAASAAPGPIRLLPGDVER